MAVIFLLGFRFSYFQSDSLLIQSLDTIGAGPVYGGGFGGGPGGGGRSGNVNGGGRGYVRGRGRVGSRGRGGY